MTQVPGGFIVVGNTDQGGGNTDIFIMMINCDGSLAWVRTYGAPNNGPNSDDQAYDVVIATSGNAFNGTAAGDIIVCGHSNANNPMGSVLGYLLRTTNAGVLIWDATYNLPQPHLGERTWFRSLIQASPIGLIGQTTGDIVAVGGTDMVGNVIEALVVRVDGDNGAILPNPPSYHGMATYGGATVDEFWTVIEHSTKPLPPAAQVNYIICAGNTTYLNPGPPAKNTSEIYLLKAFGDVTIPEIECHIGDGAAGTLWEDAHSMLEMPVLGSAGNTAAGDLALTGIWWNVMALLTPQQDAHLLTITVPFIPPPPPPPAPPLPAVPPTIILSRHYGGQAANKNDIGNSICWYQQGFGWTIAGATNSNLQGTGPVDPEDMYVINADDVFGSSGDCSLAWSPGPTMGGFGAVTHAPIITALGLSSNSYADDYWPVWDGPSVCPRGFIKPALPSRDSKSIGVTGAFPNPVIRGNDLRIHVPAAIDAESSIDVLNGRGEVVMNIPLLTPGGSEPIIVKTSPLVPGIYSLRVKDAKRSRAVPFIVLE